MRLTFDTVGVDIDGRPIIAGVSLTVPQGQVTALVGPNGSG